MPSMAGGGCLEMQECLQPLQHTANPTKVCIHCLHTYVAAKPCLQQYTILHAVDVFVQVNMPQKDRQTKSDHETPRYDGSAGLCIYNLASCMFGMKPWSALSLSSSHLLPSVF